jgi:hypothetical protein
MVKGVTPTSRRKPWATRLAVTEPQVKKMTKTCASSMRIYRIRKSFAAVHFDQTGKGRIFFLPEGAELRLMGPSFCWRQGFEVMYQKQLYNIFKEDLLGPWSTPIESSSIESRRSQTTRAETASEACA